MYEFTCTKNFSFNAIFPVLDGEGHQASNTIIIYTYKLGDSKFMVSLSRDVNYDTTQSGGS